MQDRERKGMVIGMGIGEGGRGEGRRGGRRERQRGKRETGKREREIRLGVDWSICNRRPR